MEAKDVPDLKPAADGLDQLGQRPHFGERQRQQLLDEAALAGVTRSTAST